MTWARPDGYVGALVNGREMLEHVAIAERALGRSLQKGEQVHHVNEVRSDNAPDNLVICPDQAYHQLLHRRADAIRAGCPPEWRRCAFCGRHDAPAAMRIRNKARDIFEHAACRNANQRAYRASKKGAMQCQTPH